MSITMNSVCYVCHMTRAIENARAYGDDEKATRFARELIKLYTTLPEDASSTWLGPATAKLMQEIFGQAPDRLKEEKALSNRFAMERLDAIRSKIAAAADPLFCALQFAVLGNYLDFAALQGKVSFQQLEDMLQKALQMQLDMDSYRQFREDLAKGSRLLYITDNAGEIAFDRLFAEQIHKEFPHVQIIFCVRGAPVHNDATRQDAEAVGIPFPVIDSGSDIGGTQIDQLGAEAKAALDSADVVIAKGMGNIETMYGSGYNVYYAFLIKCPRLMEFFRKEMMTPMFLRELSQ